MNTTLDTKKIHKPYELVGKKIGHITVLRYLNTVNKMKKYLVRCECGNLHETYGKTLMNVGKNNSDYRCDKCRYDKVRQNKMKFIRYIDSKAWNAWNYMVKVCYPRRGNINRTICKEWMDFFEFLKAMSEPKENQCLFLVKQFGEYNKNSCKWTDHHQVFINLNNM